jgi:hypothetical protein
MSDKNQDELRKRFNRSPNRETDENESTDEESTDAESAASSERNETGERNQTDNTDETGETDEIDQTDGTDERNESDEMDDTDELDEMGETDGTGQSQGQSPGGLKGRKQVAMYLPAELRGELSDFYEELDARSTLAGDGGLQKNREFYEGVIEFVLDHRQAFADSLGIEIDDE